MLRTISLAALALIAGWAEAAQPTFSGIGQLAPGQFSRAVGISPDGTLVVGEAINASGQTVAVLYDRSSGSPSLLPLGFMTANAFSTATDVALDAAGGVHITGTARDNSNQERAFHWSGTRAGVGTYQALALLSGGNKSNGYGILVDPAGMIWITGRSTSGDTTYGQAFRWRSDSASTLGLGYLPSGGSKRGVGLGIAWEDNATTIVGWSDSNWDRPTGGSPEAFRWRPGGNLTHQFGLDRVCGGESWQIGAGPNGVADTTAGSSDLQTTAVGTSGLAADAVVVSAGPDNVLLTNPAGDDIALPVGVSPDASSQSFFRAISPDGRYMVGDATYPDDGDTRPAAPFNQPRQACLKDTKNRDYEDNDNCGGFAFMWPLGFLPGDDYSMALGVSNGVGGTRKGLTITGWSRKIAPPPATSGYLTQERAFLCVIEDAPDIWFLRQQNAAEDDFGAPVASRFQHMRDLRAWLISEGVDLDAMGWTELRRGNAVSDDGSVIAGVGIHNGVEEGFVVTVPVPPPIGACCNRTGLGTGTCSRVTEGECQDAGGAWLGRDSSCGAGNGNCDFCPTPFADADFDSDVDMDDFGTFQTCVSGTLPLNGAGCACLDAAADGRIDGADLVEFEKCVTGPDVPYDPQNPPSGCGG